VNTRASLDDVEKRKFLTLQGLELRPLSPARSQLLYRLPYPDYIVLLDKLIIAQLVKKCPIFFLTTRPITVYIKIYS
jgi:hypothetical protein